MILRFCPAKIVRRMVPPDLQVAQKLDLALGFERARLLAEGSANSTAASAAGKHSARGPVQTTKT